MHPRMKSFVMLMFVVLALILIFIQREKRAKEMKNSDALQSIKLPPPRSRGIVSVEEAILKRRSERSYNSQPLTWKEISQLLWAAQGITDVKMGLRSAPSAGAVYPIEIYVVFEEGLYHYIPDGHTLEKLSNEDLRPALCRAALGQKPIEDAPMDIVITAVYERTAGKYGERGSRYVHMEAGHVAENIQLQAVAAGLGSVPIGAFSDEGVAKALSLPRECSPLYIIPIGSVQ